MQHGDAAAKGRGKERTALALCALGLVLNACLAPLPIGPGACGRLRKHRDNGKLTAQRGKQGPRAGFPTQPGPRRYAIHGCVLNLARRTATVRASGPISLSATTQDNCFRIEGLPPGEYTVIVRHRDYDISPGIHRVKIVDRDVTELSFRAQPRRSRSGR